MSARRFKLPVLSRLAWAWLGFAALGAGALAYSTAGEGGRRAAVKMAVEGIERFAPPPRPAETRTERLAAGETSAAATEIREEAFDDAFAAPDAEDALGPIEGSIAPADPAADIFITIDGAPARAIGEAKTRATALVASPVAAPDEGLLKRTAYGQIPRIGADGRRASKVYAKPFTPGKEPAVALIVGGLGLNQALTERAIDDLPAGVTLAFAPYAKDLPFWTKRARDAGHEVMIEIPMENRANDAEALGPAALLTSRSDAENAQRLDWLLSRFQGYFGVTNYLGAKFSGDRDAVEAFAARINAAGLAYVDDTGLVDRAAGVDRFIDPGYGETARKAADDLQSLEKIATRKGDALGKTYVNDATLDDVATWAGALGEKGLALAPASAVLAMRAGDR